MPAPEPPAPSDHCHSPKRHCKLHQPLRFMGLTGAASLPVGQQRAASISRGKGTKLGTIRCSVQGRGYGWRESGQAIKMSMPVTALDEINATVPRDQPIGCIVLRPGSVIMMFSPLHLLLLPMPDVKVRLSLQRISLVWITTVSDTCF